MPTFTYTFEPVDGGTRFTRQKRRAAGTSPHLFGITHGSDARPRELTEPDQAARSAV
jgi:hypothetical protein